MTSADRRFPWLALAAVPGVGPVSFKALINAFGHPDRVFAAGEAELKAAGMGEKAIRSLRGFRPPDALCDELKKADDLGLQLVHLKDPGYPERLYAIPDPPPYLYVKGALSEADGVALAIVGSRRSTFYGQEVSVRLSRELAGRGMTIVSGMALGIDTCAHKGALDAGGRTIAVLGCGLGHPLPRGAEELARKVAANGALISEFPLDAAPNPENFPKRNRIISGLSLGTLVVEAAHDSGSLITARCARSQGRPVFAVPGNLTSPQSNGTNALLKDGAKLVLTVDDVVREMLPFLKGKPGPTASEKATRNMRLSPEEERVYRKLSLEPCHIDRLAAESGMAVHQVSGILMTMELKGIVRQLPGKMFVAD